MIYGIINVQKKTYRKDHTMDCTNDTTKRRTGQHLTFEERVIIQTRWNDGWNNNQIAKEIGCSYNCIKTEIARGMTPLYNGKVMRYKARTGQMVYELNRSKCIKGTKAKISSFVNQKGMVESLNAQLDELALKLSAIRDQWIGIAFPKMELQDTTSLLLNMQISRRIMKLLRCN